MILFFNNPNFNVTSNKLLVATDQNVTKYISVIPGDNHSSNH